ncbi:hypothetical protein SAMN06296241_2279 [Salinimicrobium sediminis]|uniref:Uncharacterized protein n=1 Tax=Salinimicrobium sediminis TaxID=1343891 RepID=A0A285X5U8_9FLAO|nr:hypothetical protein [Salinimicrobium sediminis]SOC80723.1 hypothetical protein SAMN06296241_2279 [Salinimicrobium sediminis]
MTKFIYFLSCFFIVASLAAQEIHYEYIKVPDKFEFQKAENQYQLNALTAFLFEKYGFKTLYKNGMPAGVKPCDVLTANVHDDSNLFRTKLYVTLTDCENRVVFTTETGSSREKAFKPSQHEALRNAFASFENVEITSKVTEKVASGNNNNEKELPEEIVVDPIVTSEEIEEVAVEEISSEAEAEITPSEAERNPSEAGKIQKFTNGPVTYLLRSTSAGYELFREGEQQKFASLMKSGGGDNFLYSSKNVSGNAFFDGQGNLVVEYLDPNSQQLISVIYKVQAQ